MKKSETKSELLKRAYHVLLLNVSLTIAYVAVICRFVLPSLSSNVAQFLLCVVPPMIVLGLGASQQRRRLERAGITGIEWQAFVWTQPLVKWLGIGVAIVLVLRVFKVIK
jgi:hypothetical protein